jgi:hypothetical protein
MNNERQIDQKFDGLWRLIIWGYSIPMGVLFLHALFARNITAVGVTLMVYVILYLVAKIIQRMSDQEKPTWFLAEEGLKRVHPDGEPDSIPWLQIKSMKYMKYIGLFIQWNKTKSDQKGAVVAYEEVSSILSVGKNEANEVFSLWHRNHVSTSRQSSTIKKIPNRSDVLQGGKAVVAGCFGLLLVLLEISSKHWSLAILFGLASATALTLGLGALKGKFKGKKGVLLRNVLIMLLGIWLVCILVYANSKNYHNN